VRLRVAYALGQLAGTEAAPVVLRLLDDLDRSVREQAVDALGRIGGPIAVDALLTLAVDPAHPQRRYPVGKDPHAWLPTTASR
jgi:HEAT repeat protein